MMSIGLQEQRSPPGLAIRFTDTYIGLMYYDGAAMGCIARHRTYFRSVPMRDACDVLHTEIHLIFLKFKGISL